MTGTSLEHVGGRLRLGRAPIAGAAAEIVAWAAREHAAWFWRGVGSPELR